MKKLHQIPSWDLALALTTATAVYLTLPYHISGYFLREIYQTALLLLTVLFVTPPLIIAFLYIQNRDFEKGPEWRELTAGYRFTLLITGISLLYCAAIYFFTSYSIQENPEYLQNKTWVSLITWFTVYSISGLLHTGLIFFRIITVNTKQ
jgi:hypothetical protein